MKSAYKAALVERFNRTLKHRLWRYFTSKFTSKWTDVLQDAVHAYNHSVHRMIKKRPVEAVEAIDELREQMQSRVKPPKGKTDIKVGDKVRISKVKSVFAKGYLPNWTEEIFTVAEIDDKYTPRMYKLKDYQGHIIEGSFYRKEIELIIKNDDVYIVEKILRWQTRHGEQWALMKWLGYPESMNSWVRQFDLSDLQP